MSTLSTLSFRNLADAEIALGSGVTVVHGDNGAGKTNLLEALFFGLTGRSCRTRREREAITFGADLARVEVALEPEPGEGAEPMVMLASISRGDARRRLVDGRTAAPDDDRRRPALSVFMPDRLHLVKGPPSPRRAHLDRLTAALWPGRGELRRAYGRALAQRNALLARSRAGGGLSALDAWDRELAAAAIALVEARAAAAEALAGPFAEAAAALGLQAGASIEYRPCTAALDLEGITTALHERRASDLARGFSGFGPHRDEVEISLGERSLRRYGSQGQQRLGLLALLFAERAALQRARRQLPLMLLDDVMSELDSERRGRLVEMLEAGGQALITTTELGHVPAGPQTVELLVEAGAAMTGAPHE